jgi:hypothetical protein
MTVEPARWTRTIRGAIRAPYEPNLGELDGTVQRFWRPWNLATMFILIGSVKSRWTLVTRARCAHRRCRFLPLLLAGQGAALAMIAAYSIHGPAGSGLKTIHTKKIRWCHEQFPHLTEPCLAAERMPSGGGLRKIGGVDVSRDRIPFLDPAAPGSGRVSYEGKNVNLVLVFIQALGGSAIRLKQRSCVLR